MRGALLVFPPCRLSRLFERERLAYEAEIEATFETPEQAKER